MHQRRIVRCRCGFKRHGLEALLVQSAPGKTSRTRNKDQKPAFVLVDTDNEVEDCWRYQALQYKWHSWNFMSEAVSLSHVHRSLHTKPQGV